MEENNKIKFQTIILIFTVICVLAMLICLIIGMTVGSSEESGKSAYEIAVENGFTGTEREWLESLHGTSGTDGAAWYTGESVPEASQGTDGDFYFIASSFDLYRKTDGEWSLIGNLKAEPCNHVFDSPIVVGQSEDGNYWLVEEHCTVEGCGHFTTHKKHLNEVNISSYRFEADNSETLAMMFDSGVECVNLKDGADITLNSDIATAGRIEIAEGSTVSVKLNGNNLISSYAGAFIKNYGTLTIDDQTNTGSIYTTDTAAQGRAAIINYGTATINGGSFGSNQSRGQAFTNLGEATINGGHFTACDNYVNGGFAYAVGNGHEKYPNAVMTINDATVSGKMNGALANDGGTMIVKGGTYSLGEGNSSNNFYLAYASAGTLIIENGTFTRNVNNAHGFFYTDGGAIDIQGGNFEDAVNTDIIIAGSYITKISTPMINTVKVVNSRIALKEGITVRYAADQAALTEEESIFEGYLQYSSDPTSNVYYFWNTERGDTAGIFTTLSQVIQNQYLMNGEFISLLKDVVLDSDLTVPFPEGKFTLTLGKNTFTGTGKLILPCGVSVVCDKECGALKATEGCTLSVIEQDGKFVYTSVSE